MNNFAYVRCTGPFLFFGSILNFVFNILIERHCVAVFEKLYLETRSQFSHYLEFSLWFEKLSQHDGLDQYGREMFYPALGANTFQTDNFIPKNTSEVEHSPFVRCFQIRKLTSEMGWDYYSWDLFLVDFADGQRGLV